MFTVPQTLRAGRNTLNNQFEGGQPGGFIPGPVPSGYYLNRQTHNRGNRTWDLEGPLPSIRLHSSVGLAALLLNKNLSVHMLKTGGHRQTDMNIAKEGRAGKRRRGIEYFRWVGEGRKKRGRQKTGRPLAFGDAIKAGAGAVQLGAGRLSRLLSRASQPGRTRQRRCGRAELYFVGIGWKEGRRVAVAGVAALKRATTEDNCWA